MSHGSSIRILSGGMLALVVAMGIGRFAYTPAMPLMMEQQGMTAFAGGYLASSNYIGYLAGALVLTFYKPRHRSRTLFASLLLSAGTTMAMGWTESMTLWLLLRLVSGMASAAVFVLASSLVLERLSGIQTGLFYGGVGCGILWTGLGVPVLAHEGNWATVWMGLGWSSVVFACLAIGLLRVVSAGSSESGRAVAADGEGAPAHRSHASPSQHRISAAAASAQSSKQISAKPSMQSSAQAAVVASRTPEARRAFRYLTAAYGLEGLGYIVTGTFLVAHARTMTDATNISSLSWTIVGVSAAISCVIWSTLAGRWGKRAMLIAALVLQAIGIAIPVVIPTLAAVFIGAVLFGGTFMGITTLAVPYAKELHPHNQVKMLGLLTAIYGLGQVLGPIFAGQLIAWQNSYAFALLGAAAVVLLGAGALLLGKRVTV